MINYSYLLNNLCNFIKKSMNIILPGDKDYESRPSVQRKSLRINLNENIYGTFVEIGAGQEVARNFYRVGAASGTIAKSMSAYDKSFSDSIYGKEEDGRYVTQNRLDKMLNHEMNLLEKEYQEIRILISFSLFMQTQLLLLILLRNLKVMDGWVLNFKPIQKMIIQKLNYT